MKRSLVMPMKPLQLELEFETNGDVGKEKDRMDGSREAKLSEGGVNHEGQTDIKEETRNFTRREKMCGGK